ncbi:hypothetical protein B0T25DRAFT_459449 [Lasiosphaeria hispida]|uniref:Uncharacterized protein n=1 Tax=Lasiosphaeria hispida TaxID=260671 RepID=A0AAJ0MCJ2_9PEZI|nr:hypothetical protein B0T25DRAFT_459449 [Lasiosphaeria hispida]
MPIHDTLQSIRLHFGAQYVDLPDHSTLDAHSKLKGKQKRDSTIVPIVTAPNTPPPSPRNVARGHSELDLTLDLPSKNDTARLKPTNKGHYDSIETIAYQLRQLPKEGETTNPPSFIEWNRKNFFAPLNLEVRVAEGRDCHAAKAGLTNVLSWMVDMEALRNGAHISFDEFSLDESGNMCQLGHNYGTVAGPSDSLPFNSTSRPLLGSGGSIYSRPGSRRKIKEHITDATQTLSTTPWTGQRFGKEWRFELNGLRDESIFSIAALQLCDDADLDQTHRHGALIPTMQRFTRRFLTQFKGEWETSRRNLWGGTPTFKKPGEDLVFQYHMRALTAPPWLMPLGSGLRRVNGTLAKIDHSHINLREVRYSVGLKTTWRLDFPVFCLITMADSTVGRLQELPQLGEINAWDTAGIHPSARATGVAAFSFRVRSLLPLWGAQWSCLLDAIERLLATDILRIAADWIQESLDDLRQMVDDIQERYFSSTTDEFATFLPLEPSLQDAAFRTFKQNWESVMLLQQRIGTALLSRIAKEQDHVKSLQDGLFNTTSVIEATKSTKLNSYILTFTIITIIYLPLSFIAVRTCHCTQSYLYCTNEPLIMPDTFFAEHL